ncbi:MAG: cell division protein ZapA [Alphaproteobacteria bacterium]
MAQLDVSVNGRSYRVACDDGQEDHLRQLAEYVDRRVMELVGAVGQVGEARLLVMASLLIADDLSESFATSQGKSDEEAEDKLAEVTDALAKHIETIAAGLEAA